MLETIEAIYENGTFKPLHPVDLPEGTRVTIAPAPTAQPQETPVVPGIVRRADRGLCVAGTKLSLFTLMEYVQAGHQQDLLTYGQLSAEQLQQTMDYIAAHRVEFNAAYAEYRRKANELESHYRARQACISATQQRSPNNLTPTQAAIWERLQARQRQSDAQ